MHSGVGQLQVEVVDGRGSLAVRLVFDADGAIKVKGAGRLVAVGLHRPHAWIDARISVDTTMHRFDLALNDALVVSGGTLASPLRSVERLIFRTGPRRHEPTLDTDRFEGEDLPHADEPAMPAVFCVNSVKTYAHQ